MSVPTPFSPVDGITQVTVISHPLVQHKLTLMRKRETSTARFRQLLREISTLLCYEVTRDLELRLEEIETPLCAMKAPLLEGKKLVFASILRAGNGLLEGMLDLVPSARVAHIGVYRDHETLAAHVANVLVRRVQLLQARHRVAAHRLGVGLESLVGDDT